MKLILVPLIAKNIPEAFFLVLAVAAFCKVRLSVKKYLLISLGVLVSTYVIRMLPIHFGVHTLLNILVLIFLMVWLCPLPIYDAIKASLLVPIILFVLEGVNILGLKFFFAGRFLAIMDDPILKVVAGLPTTVAFGLTAVVAYSLRVLRRPRQAC